MNAIKTYFNVYKGFVASCFAEGMTYRFHFVMLIAMDIFFYIVSLMSIDFIFNHVGRIGIWNREEFMFYVAFMLALDQLHMTFISENFWALADQIRRGQMDYTLLKPLSTLFTTFFRYIRPASLFNIFVTVPMLIYYGIQADLPALSWAFLPVLLLLALTLLVSTEILISCSMFWVVEGYGINFLRIQFQTISRWPDFIYSPWPRRFLTFFVPVLLIGNAPVRFMFDNDDYWPFIYMVIAIGIIWLLIGHFWNKGIRNYESASS